MRRCVQAARYRTLPALFRSIRTRFSVAWNPRMAAPSALMAPFAFPLPVLRLYASQRRMACQCAEMAYWMARSMSFRYMMKLRLP